MQNARTARWLTSALWNCRASVRQPGLYSRGARPSGGRWCWPVVSESVPQFATETVVTGISATSTPVEASPWASGPRDERSVAGRTETAKAVRFRQHESRVSSLMPLVQP